MSRKPNIIIIRGKVAAIQLSNGGEALVDIEDVPLVEGRFWSVKISSKGKTPYCSSVKGHRQRVTSMLHHVILGKPPKGMITDHINGNGLDNRKKNLRFTTAGINSYNRANQSNCPNGFRGVYKATKTKQGKGKRDYYEAKIGHKGHSIYLGLFQTAEDAAHAYDAKARELYGLEAKTNFPPILASNTQPIQMPLNMGETA